MKYKVLNLYACLGGNRFNWDKVAEEAGVELEVTAIEYNETVADQYRIKFPKDNVIVTDAHEYLLYNYDKFDFIWASPPCPTHSKMMKATRHDTRSFPDMKLYEEIIFLQHFFNGKWVVENVISYYKPLIHPYKSSRHYYWSNFTISPVKNLPKLKDMSRATRSQMADYLGFDYYGKNIYLKGNHCPVQVLRNCVHPLEGEHIFRIALGVFKDDNKQQQKLF